MYNNGGERLRIDGTGRVLIGAQRTYDSGTYYDDIVVNNSNTASGAAGGAGISLVCGATSYGGVIFSNGSSHGRGYMKYDMTDDQLVLGTQTVDRFMIEDSGNNGDVHILTGNIVINQAGKGIDFSAQTASSATGASNTAEILDHYEDGTWTPTTSEGNSHTVFGTPFYTRIGRQVTAACYINITSSSSSSSVRINGLPFTAVGNSHFAIGSCYTQFTADKHVFFQVNSGGDYGYIYTGLGTGVAYNATNVAGGYFLMTVTYFVA